MLGQVAPRRAVPNALSSRPVHPSLRGNSRLTCWDSWSWDEGTFNHDQTCSDYRFLFPHLPLPDSKRVHPEYIGPSFVAILGSKGRGEDGCGVKMLAERSNQTYSCASKYYFATSGEGGGGGMSVTITDRNRTPSLVHHYLDVHCVQLLRKGPILFVLPATTQNWSHHGQSPPEARRLHVKCM